VDDLPDNFNVYAKIIVDYPVSQANDFVPFDFRMISLELVGQAIRGLTYNLKISDYGVYSFLVD
jgi:hypothetical protein